MRNPVNLVRLVMSLFYLFAGGYILIKQVFPSVPRPFFDYEWTIFQENPWLLNTLVGGILIAYGSFRLYRALTANKEGEEE